MKTPMLAKLVGAGLASTAAVASAVLLTWGPPGLPDPSPPGALSADSGLVFCVAADRRLFQPDSTGCGGGTELELQEADTDPPDGGNWGEDGPLVEHHRPGLPGPLADIDRRLAALENRPLFEVVDSAGAPMLRVAPGAATVFRSGSALVGIRATLAGGFLSTRSAAGGMTVSVGTSGALGGIRVEDGGVLRADVGRLAAGNYGLRFPSLGGGLLAGLGQSRAGTGTLVIGDARGRPRATMTIDDAGKGILGISGSDGASLLTLTQGATAGGLLAIGDATSNTMVKMGVQADRYGVVMTGPKDIGPLIPATGLPGSYILGCAGGASCAPGAGR